MDLEIDLAEIDPIKAKNKKLFARRGSGRRQDHANRQNSLRSRALDDPDDKIRYRNRRDRRHGLEDWD